MYCNRFVILMEFYSRNLEHIHFRFRTETSEDNSSSASFYQKYVLIL